MEPENRGNFVVAFEHCSRHGLAEIAFETRRFYFLSRRATAVGGRFETATANLSHTTGARSGVPLQDALGPAANAFFRSDPQHRRGLSTVSAWKPRGDRRRSR